MSEDPHNQRFFSYLSLFTFFMLLLVSGANFFVMFVGWEGIGVVSYLLINFWFTRLQANKAAILAFTMNRVGDMGLSIGFFAIFALFGSIDYATVFSLSSYMNETAITVIGLLLLSGAMAKSSQIPLHSWLPGSMEGTKYFYFIIIFLLFYSLLDLNLIDTIVDFTFCSILPLTQKLINPIVGDLLCDGHLRFTHKDTQGQVRGNAHYAMTLKHYDYAFYLWKDIYSSICTTTPLRPWPNPIVTGKTPTQYAFSSKSLPALTELHSQWYKLDKEKNKFIKIVPLDIGNLLTPIGIANWIMGDGYWDISAKTVVICTTYYI
jgi:NADH:ubiquinone oxidoreductase subunit 5 (chain L)/Multisubunit Na+/H+ antiporter, MnhA subunit